MYRTEAVKILAISGDINQEIIKAAYRKACFKFHPDRNPAGLEMMKLINIAFEVLKKESDFTIVNDTPDYDDKLSDAIKAALRMEGIDIEVCGVWVWLSGDTRPHKEEIKKSGYKWASKKMKWYFRPADYKSRSRGKFSMEDIRTFHGSREIRAEKEERKKIK